MSSPDGSGFGGREYPDARHPTGSREVESITLSGPTRRGKLGGCGRDWALRSRGQTGERGTSVPFGTTKQGTDVPRSPQPPPPRGPPAARRRGTPTRSGRGGRAAPRRAGTAGG